MDGMKKKEKANDKESALCELDFCVPCITISDHTLNSLVVLIRL